MAWNLWKKRTPENAPPDNPSEEDILCIDKGTKELRAGRLRNPCLSCGACCAFFLVSFPTRELDRFAGGLVPAELSGSKPASLSFMRGTEDKKPRCIALDGFIGSRVKCTIYTKRPSTCMAFCRSWESNVGNFLCDRARAAYGLQVFSQY